MKAGRCHEIMRLQLVMFKCAECTHPFKSPRKLGNSYGEFVLYSGVDAELVYLDALGDPVYQEVGLMVASNTRLAGRGASKVAEALQQVFGELACEPGNAGNPFKIAGMPVCPRCGSQEMKSWEATEPAEYVEQEVLMVTHIRWNQLRDVEKKTEVDASLRSIGY